MKPGDLRRFRDNFHALGAEHLRGSTFMVLHLVDVLQGDERTEGETWRWVVDILLDSKREEGLGYDWVMDSSEVISEAG